MTAGPVQRSPDAGHVRGSALLSLGRVVSLLFTVSAQILVVRALTKQDYGLFGYALMLASGTRVLLSLGQNRNLSRFLAVYDEQRDTARLLGTLVLVTCTVAVMSTGLLTVLILAHGLSSGGVVGSSSALITLSILLLLAPMEALDQAFVSLFAVFSRPTTIFFRKYVFTPLMRLTVVALLIVLDGDVRALALGYVGTQAVGLLLYLALAVRLLRERAVVAGRRVSSPRLVLPFRAVFSLSLPLLSTDLLWLCLHSGNALLLGGMAGAAAVASYHAVYSSARLNSFLSASFETLYLPRISRLLVQDDRPAVREAYWHTGAILAVTSFPVFALTVPFAQQTTTALFGERYAASSSILALLGLGYYVNACFGFNTVTLQVFGRVRWIMTVNVLAAFVAVCVSVVLIPRLGALGVGVSTCAALVVQNVLNQVALRSTIGTGFVDRSHAGVYLRIVAAGALLALLSALLRPPFPVAVLLAALASTGLLAACRRQLRLGEDFPELLRLPLLGRLVG